MNHENKRFKNPHLLRYFYNILVANHPFLILSTPLKEKDSKAQQIKTSQGDSPLKTMQGHQNNRLGLVIIAF